MPQPPDILVLLFLILTITGCIGALWFIIWLLGSILDSDIRK